MHLLPGQRIHIIGIAGTGMSAIARILLQQGYVVSGSDQSSNALTNRLKREGATIYNGHSPANLADAEIVIRSSAVHRENIEILTAIAGGIPVYKRADIIGALMADQVGIAVAGTHGKTTTASMITDILVKTGHAPSYILGGILRSTKRNAETGSGRAFVVEADEYDNMFHGLRPQIEVITNVEYDHPDFFKTPRDLTEAFNHFVGLLPADGLLVACADDPTAIIYAKNREVVELPVATYGIDNPQALWRATNLRVDARHRTVFEVMLQGKTLGTGRLQVPGKHNVLNALAALIVADHQGIPFKKAAAAAARYRGTRRRFQIRSDRDGVAMIDDYAHHPTAIQATLQAARERYPDRALWAVWQPHTFSRTQQFWERYLTSFIAADHVLITDIYAARETPVPGVSAQGLVAAMNHADVRHTPTFKEAVLALETGVEAPAAIIIMSAGDAPKIGRIYLKRRSKREDR